MGWSSEFEHVLTEKSDMNVRQTKCKMIIGIAGPMTLSMLPVQFTDKRPVGYSFPMTSSLINSLIEQGHFVIAFTTSTDLTENMVIDGEHLRLCIAPREPHDGRDLFYSERKALEELIYQNRPDIIHALWSYEFAWAAINSKVPTLVSVYDNATRVLRYQLDPYRLMRWVANFIVLRKAKYLAVNSPYLFSALPNYIQKRTVVLDNFFDKSMLHYGSLKTHNSNIIVTVTNGYGKLKNQINALKAFSMIAAEFPNIEYHLIGDMMEVGGPAFNYSTQNGLLKNVSFCGFLNHNDVLKKIAKANIFLHPSREESFGMAVLEAMVLGTPVIGGKQSGNIPFLLENGKSGMLCDINSPDEIAVCIKKMLLTKKVAKELAIRAKKWSNRYHEDIVVPTYLAAYDKILQTN